MNFDVDGSCVMALCIHRHVPDLRTSERGGREIVGVGQRDQLDRLAAHDERARKSGYEHKMRRIELLKNGADVVP